MSDNGRHHVSAKAVSRHPVQKERLVKAAAGPSYVKLPVRVACHALIGMIHMVTTFFGRLRRSGSKSDGTPPARIVVMGTFLADNWVSAHVQPLASSSQCRHIWVVCDRPLKRLDKVTYVCPPSWLAKLIGRVPARSVMFVLTAVLRQADIVGGFHLFFNGLLALCVARVLGVRAMYFCVGGWAEFAAGGAYSGHTLFGRLGVEDQRLERSLLRTIGQFDMTITMGTRARDLLISHGVNPVTVVSGGIDPERFAAGERTPQPDFDLILVARLDRIKRIDVFLNVVREVASTVPDVSAVVVGDGPMRDELEELADRLEIRERVTFAGFQANVSEWLARAKVLVISSDSEGLPLSAMEAITLGLPVVASDVGDLGDLVRDGSNGFLVPPRDIGTFAERIVELLQNTPKLKRFAAKARRTAPAYGLDSTRRRWDTLLPQLVSARYEQTPVRNARRSDDATRVDEPAESGAEDNGAWVIRLDGPGTSGGKPVDILFLGDVALAGGVSGLIDLHGFEFPFEQFPEGFFDADVVCYNLECCLSHRGTPWEPKPVHFRGSPDYLDVFPKIDGRYVANVANNHFLDYGEEAAVDTLTALKKRDILHFGATGPLAKEQPLILPTEAGSVGFLGFSPAAHPLPNGSPMNVAVGTVEMMADHVRRAQEAVDILIVSLHQGVEYSSHIDRRSHHTARRLIDAGADCVVGHHAHVVQAIEHYRRGIIFHGIGNLLIDVDNARRPEAAVTLALRMSLCQGRIKHVAVEPYAISEQLQPRSLNARDRNKLRKRIAELSGLLVSRSGRTRNDLSAGRVWTSAQASAVVDMCRRKGTSATATYYGKRTVSKLGVLR